MSGGNCHVAAIRVAPGSSEAIAHGIGKHREVQKPLLVSLRADICLLRLVISASTEHSSCVMLCPQALNLSQTLQGQEFWVRNVPQQMRKLWPFL